MLRRCMPHYHCSYCVRLNTSLMSMLFLYSFVVFFFKQKTAYEMRISDWSSDVCSSDLQEREVDSQLRCWTRQSFEAIASATVASSITQRRFPVPHGDTRLEAGFLGLRL